MKKTINTLFDDIKKHALNQEYPRYHILTSEHQTPIPNAFIINIGDIPCANNTNLIQIRKKETQGQEIDYIYEENELSSLLFNLEKSLIDKEQLTNSILYIKESFLRSNNIHDLLKDMYSLFKNPLIITDEFLHPLAYYPQEETNCIPFDNLIQRTDMQVSIIQNNIADIKIYQMNGATFSCFKPFNIPAITYPITHNDVIIGGFSLFEHNRQLTETDRQLVEYFMLLLSTKSIIQDLKKRNDFHLILSNLIQNKISAYDYIPEIVAFHHSVDERKCVAYVPSLVDKKDFASLFQTDMVLNINNTTICIYDSDVTQKIRKECDEFTKRNNCTIIISNAPYPLCDIHDCYHIALECMSFLEKRNELTNRVFYTLDYFYELMLLPLIDHPKKNKEYLPYYHGLNLLRTYDKEHGTDYYQTLYTYVMKLASLNETSEALNIHRNTLTYRLSKIEEISTIHLETSNNMINLLLVLKLVEAEKAKDFS